VLANALSLANDISPGCGDAFIDFTRADHLRFLRKSALTGLVAERRSGVEDGILSSARAAELLNRRGIIQPRRTPAYAGSVQP
jgi:hypothetical protein